MTVETECKFIVKNLSKYLVNATRYDAGVYLDQCYKLYN